MAKFVVIKTYKSRLSEETRLSTSVIDAATTQAALDQVQEDDITDGEILAISHPLGSDGAFYGLRSVGRIPPRDVLYQVKDSSWINAELSLLEAANVS